MEINMRNEEVAFILDEGYHRPVALKKQGGRWTYMTQKRTYRDVEKDFHKLMKTNYYPKQHNEKIQLLMDELKDNYDFTTYTEDTSRAIALHYYMSQKFQTDKPSLF